VPNQEILELYSTLYPNFSKVKTAAQLLSTGKDRANVTLQKDRKWAMSALGDIGKSKLQMSYSCNQELNLAIPLESMLSIKVCQK